jgi:ketosteroid isomerase-like protein
MTTFELVKQAYADFAAGNVKAVLAIWDPEIEWLECKGMPFVNDDGIYIGHDAVMKNVLMQLPVYFDGFNIEVNEIFGSENRVVMEGYYRGTNKATGNQFKAHATHIWTVKNGKMTRFFQAVDTVTIVS